MGIGIPRVRNWGKDFQQVALSIAIVRDGKKDGIQFTRASSESPSDLAIDRLLHGYLFSYEERDQIVNNIIVRGAATAHPEDGSVTVLRYEP